MGRFISFPLYKKEVLTDEKGQEVFKNGRKVRRIYLRRDSDV